VNHSHRRTIVFTLVAAFAVLMQVLPRTQWGFGAFAVLLLIAWPAGIVTTVVLLAREKRVSGRVLGVAAGLLLPVLAAGAPGAHEIGNTGLWFPVDWVGIACGTLAGCLALALLSARWDPPAITRAAIVLIVAELALVVVFFVWRHAADLPWEPVLYEGETALGDVRRPAQMVGRCFAAQQPLLGASIFAVLGTAIRLLRGSEPWPSLVLPLAALGLALLTSGGLLWHAGVRLID
jgi:hypothetical protein